jgi:thiamine kinase-like enzyme
VKEKENLKSNQYRVECLSDEGLYTFVSESLRHNNVQGFVDGIDRRVLKHRCDWRGERLFERLIVRLTKGNTLILFLKHYLNDFKPDLQRSRVNREAEVYRYLLQDLQLGTANFYGLYKQSNDGGALLLEFVRGRRLKRYKNEEVWQTVAKWLAYLHHYFYDRLDELYSVRTLFRHDSNFFFNLANRAAISVSNISVEASLIMERILKDYDKVAIPLSDTLLTLLHGEFYCTNILLGHKKRKIRICPFDWETAAIGCGAFDLSYLLRTHGINKSRLIDVYFEGWQDMGGSPLSKTQLQQYIRRARVHELIYFIWSNINHHQAPADRLADRIVRYAEHVERNMEYLD